MHKLLSRDKFRESTLSRDGGNCCVPSCGLKAVDAHHILNRNLFKEDNETGGYFYENGAQLCSDHHYDAELTRISVEELREYCNIDDPAIPAHLDKNASYDCWGNENLPDGYRLMGELFTNEGCQKALKAAGVLWKLIPEKFDY
jgi:hypothetical protein